MLKKTRTAARRLGKRLHELRERSGATQEEVAAAAGLSTSYYWRVEHGRINLTLESMVRIAEALKVELADFFG